MPIIGGLGVPHEFGSRYSFPITPIFFTDGYLFGRYATNPNGPLKFKHPGILVVNTAGIDNFLNGIIKAASDNGVSIKQSDVFKVSFSDNQYPSYMAQFTADGVDGLITQLDPYSYQRMYGAETTKTFPHLAGAGIDKPAVSQSLGNKLVNTYSFMPFLEAQGNPAGNPEVDLYNNTVRSYDRNITPQMDAFSEGSWVSCRIFTQALAKLGSNVTREGLVDALIKQGPCSTRGMAPALNYANTGDKHDAAHCASFIRFNSSHQWEIVSGFQSSNCY